jgi:hypothetical protein
MNAREITRDEIAKLEHQTKIAYAARCARIIWDELKPSWPDAPKEVEEALCAVEQLGAKEYITEPEKKNLQQTLEGLPRFAAGPSSKAERAAAALAIRAAIAAAMSKHDKAAGDQKAAEDAYEAYCQALHAAKNAYYRVPYLTRARAGFDALLGCTNMPPSGAVSPEFFRPSE